MVVRRAVEPVLEGEGVVVAQAEEDERDQRASSQPLVDAVRPAFCAIDPNWVTRCTNTRGACGTLFGAGVSGVCLRLRGRPSRRLQRREGPIPSRLTIHVDGLQPPFLAASFWCGLPVAPSRLRSCSRRAYHYARPATITRRSCGKGRWLCVWRPPARKGLAREGLLDHLIGAGKERGGNCDAERRGRLEIDHQLQPFPVE